jgi:hypothetical protein
LSVLTYTYLYSILIFSSILLLSFILYLSVLTYTYLYSFIPIFPNKLSINIKGIHLSIFKSKEYIYLMFRLREYIYLLFILYLSVLTYGYLYLIQYSFPPPSSQSNNLTPHKLSEGCLEWCSFICVVFGIGLCLSWCSRFWAFDIRCLCYYILYTYYIIHILLLYLI